jgi:hypothetical protein
MKIIEFARVSFFVFIFFWFFFFFLISIRTNSL